MNVFIPASVDVLPSYTPVRRRPRTPFRDHSPIHAQVPWTTARCNRLLRPIASRILLLRKSNSTKPTLPVSDISASQFPRPVGKSRKDVLSQDHSPVRCRAPAQTGPNGDPEWVPSAVMRRRVKHKYSSRTTGSKTYRKNFEDRNLPCALPGEVTIATPIITQKARPYMTASTAVGDTVAQDQNPESIDYAAEGRKRRKLQNCPSRRCEGNPVPHDMRQKLRKVVTPSRWMLIDGLYNGLDALLKGTEKSTRPPNCGARSLFSLCLRRIPDYIAIEQDWHESQDDDDDVDVCSEVYRHLENIGSNKGEGWKPLRVVVRAHGVAMLSDAIREGLIDHIVGRGLVFLCIHALAFDEAEALLDSLISSLTAVARPSSLDSTLFDNDATACLGTLDVFASRSGRHGFQYRQLERLLRTGVLPVEWVATIEFGATWGRVIQAVSHGDQDYSDATQLLITTIMLACRPAGRSTTNLADKLCLGRLRKVPVSTKEPAVSFADNLMRAKMADGGVGNALNNTVSSLMAIIYAISITQRDKVQVEHSFGLPDSNRSAFALLESLNVDFLREMELNDTSASTNNMCTIYRRRTVTVFLALVLLLQEWHDCHESFPKPGTARVLDNIAALTILCEHNVSETASQVANVVSAIARCCAKATPGQQFGHLQKLTNYLASIASDETASIESRQLFASFTSTTAMEYAQETGDNAHIEWALEVEERVMKDWRAYARTLAKTPHKNDGNPPQGYRWEEGICEWIAKTPNIRGGVVPNTSHEQYDVSSEPDQETYQPPHPEASSMDISFGASRALPMTSDNTSPVTSSRGSKRRIDGIAKNKTGTHIFITQHANTAGHAVRARAQGQMEGQRRSLRRGHPDAGPNARGKLHADNHEDELSMSESLAEHVKSREWKLRGTALGSTSDLQGRDSRPALRSSKWPPSRSQNALRQVRVASISLDDESEDELGM